jgi:hypothetical protein
MAKRKKKGSVNPWAVCNKALGAGRSKAKHERCVKGVKKGARRSGRRIRRS